MDAKKCDKCHKLYNYPEALSRYYSIKKLHYLDEDFAVDLCDACYKKIELFLPKHE